LLFYQWFTFQKEFEIEQIQKYRKEVHQGFTRNEPRTIGDAANWTTPRTTSTFAGAEIDPSHYVGSPT
jgi:hypothetical protein